MRHLEVRPANAFEEQLVRDEERPDPVTPPHILKSSVYAEEWNMLFPTLQSNGIVAIDMVIDRGWNFEDDNLRRGLMKIARELRLAGEIDITVKSRLVRSPAETGDDPDLRKATLYLYNPDYKRPAA